jgi:undecaprenyl-diphosphatase
MQIIDQILELDQDLLLYLNNLGSPSWDSFWLVITNKLTYIPLYMFLLFLMCKNLNKKSILVLVLSLAAMITFTDQITNLFKFSFERLRPCAQEGVLELIRQSECWGYGFFSGHSSNTMATAVFTILMLKSLKNKLIYFMIPWSLTVGYSRIYLGVHYPLDVLVGLSFGSLSGLLFYTTFKALNRRFVIG